MEPARQGRLAPLALRAQPVLQAQPGRLGQRALRVQPDQQARRERLAQPVRRGRLVQLVLQVQRGLRAPPVLQVQRGPTGATRATGATKQLGPTLTFGAAQTVTADTYTLTQAAAIAGTINDLKAVVGGSGGSITTTLKINGTAVTGVNGVTVNSNTTQTFAATAANTFVQGDIIALTLVIASGAPAGANFTVWTS